MKFTRRSLAKMVAAASAPAAIPASAAAQNRPGAAPDSMAAAARAEYARAARDLATVKLPRTVEPAARFEA